VRFHRPTPGPSLEARERAERREARRIAKDRGNTYPHLRTIGHLEIKSGIPEWCIAWAVPNLTLTNTSIWLGKKYARQLAWHCTKQRIPFRLTWTAWRPCKLCHRFLLGLDAEHRWELDRRYEGHRIPCGPDCLDIHWERIEARDARRVKSA